MNFDLLERLAAVVEEKHLPVSCAAMYAGGTIRMRTIRPGDDCKDLYSVSKNFTSTAVGMCIDDGLLSLDDTVYDLFRKERPGMNPLWREVTVERVLSQTVGIDGMFLDIDTEDVFSYPKTDWLDLVLEHPFVSVPGERFAYSDSNFYLASRMVARVTGQPMQHLLAKRLFEPLHMQGWAWATCPAGHAMGGTGLFLRVADMAKLGAVYLEGGELFGVRVVSEEFVRRATQVISHPKAATGYGLSFWIPLDGGGSYHGSGMFGQAIHVLPSRGCVVAWQAHDTDGSLRQLSLEDLLDA
ncbi:MAG: serine hydrolase domain-containing protein [Eubacteriales bacterium]